MNGVYNVQERWVCSVIRKLNRDLTAVINCLMESYREGEAGPFSCTLNRNKDTRDNRKFSQISNICFTIKMIKCRNMFPREAPHRTFLLGDIHILNR